MAICECLDGSFENHRINETLFIGPVDTLGGIGLPKGRRVCRNWICGIAWLVRFWSKKEN